jgi:hypothetical protein
VAVVGTIGEQWSVSNHEGGYSSGTTVSSSHSIAPSAIEVHCFLTKVQATVDGPPGAAIGVSDFTTLGAGMTVLGPDSSNWASILYNPSPDKITAFTVSWEAFQADVFGSWFALIWE